MAGHTYTRTAEAVQALQARGFTENLAVVDQALLARESGKTFQTGDATIIEHHRFEGASDPDDMSVVYAIALRDGTRGVLVDAYGVYADPDVGAFLKGVPVQRGA